MASAATSYNEYSSISQIGSGLTWTNYAYARHEDTLFANTEQASYSYSEQSSKTLELKAPGFSIPSGNVIKGIGVRIHTSFYDTLYTYFNLTGEIPYLNVRLLKNGNPVGATVKVSCVADSFVYLGGATSKWGATWTPEAINSANFGVRISAGNLWNYLGIVPIYGWFQVLTYAYIDSVSVKIWYDDIVAPDKENVSIGTFFIRGN